MKLTLKDRHLYGAGAAACAVCCATPILALLGIAGAAATAVTFIFAGTVFALVVAASALLAIWRQRRIGRDNPCAPETGPVDLQLTGRPASP